MKKLFALVMALVFAVSLCSFSFAATPEGVYQLMANGQIIGSAVAWADNTVLLTGAQIPQDAAVVVNIGGQGVPVEGCTELEGGLYALYVPDSETGLRPLPASITLEGLSYCGVNVNGLTVSGPVENAAAILLNGHSALVFTAADTLLPGAVLLDADDRLAGIVAADYGESSGRYAAYTIESLFWISTLTSIDVSLQEPEFPADAEGTAEPEETPDVTEIPTEAPADVPTEVPTEAPAAEPTAAPAEPTAAPAAKVEETVWLEGFTVTEEKGAMIVNWSDCTITDRAEDSAFVVFVQDTGNRYYSYYQTNEDHAEIICAANRTYNIWVEHGHGEVVTDVILPDPGATFTTAESTAGYTDHSLKTTEFYIGSGSPDTDMLTRVPKLVPISPETLMSAPALFLQVTNTYQVTVEVRCNLAAMLFAPDGSVYLHGSGYLFDPALCEGDTWNMDITSLFDSCVKYSGTMYSALQAGRYALILAIDGQAMDIIEFDLN